MGDQQATPQQEPGPPPEVEAETMSAALDLVHAPDISADVMFAEPAEGDVEPVDGEVEPVGQAVEGEPGQGDESKPEGEQEGDAQQAVDDKPPEGPAAEGWAVVRRKEQRFAAERKQFKTEVAQFRQQAEEMQRQQQSIQGLLDGMREDPLAFLEKHAGVTYDDLTQRVLGDGKPGGGEVSKRVEARLEAIERQNRELQETLKRRDQEAEERQYLDRYKSDIASTLGEEEFSLLRAHPDAENEVLSFSEKWLKAHNEVLSPQDSARKMQTAWRNHLETLKSHDAVRSVFAGNGNAGSQGSAAPAPSQQVSQGSSQAPQRAASPPAITNDLGASEGPPRHWDDLSADEQFQLALRQAPEDW